MTDQPIRRNVNCPCGSGKKYKHCCLSKGYSFVEDEEGTVRRSIPIQEDMGQALQQHMDRLSEKLGRDLEPDDKLFQDEHMEHTEHALVEGMKAAGVDPAIIHAFEETGLLVSEENQHLISEDDMRQWQSAIDQYRDRHGEQEQAIVMEAFESLDPSTRQEIIELAQRCDSEEEFANFIMVGPCPQCDSENTADGEDDPEIDNACVGRCRDCGYCWCCFCDETFRTPAEASSHDCPDLDEIADLPDPF